MPATPYQRHQEGIPPGRDTNNSTGWVGGSALRQRGRRWTCARLRSDLSDRLNLSSRCLIDSSFPPDGRSLFCMLAAPDNPMPRTLWCSDLSLAVASRILWLRARTRSYRLFVPGARPRRDVLGLPRAARPPRHPDPAVAGAFNHLTIGGIKDGPFYL